MRAFSGRHAEDLIVLGNTVLHRLVRESTPEERSDPVVEWPVETLRLPTRESIEPGIRQESRGGGTTIRVTTFEVPGGVSDPTALTAGDRQVSVLVVPEGARDSDIPGVRYQVLPPLELPDEQAVQVLLSGDTRIEIAHLRAVRFYDRDNQQLTPIQVMRMADDHPGVLAVLPTAGPVQVRVRGD